MATKHDMEPVLFLLGPRMQTGAAYGPTRGGYQLARSEATLGDTGQLLGGYWGYTYYGAAS